MILLNCQKATELDRGGVHGYRDGSLQGQEVNGGHEEERLRALRG